MLFNIALVATVALIFYMLFELIKIPGIIGMILAGILLGPSGFNFILPDVLKFSTDLRSIALIVILIRVSFSLKRSEMYLIGPVAIKMGIIPVVIEASCIALLAVYFLHLTPLVALIMGLIISSVSPAIVVPHMMDLKEKINGSQKHIPTILLAGALDNIFVITIFNALIQLYLNQNEHISILLLKIPLGILLGAILGIMLGYLFIKFFKKYHVRDTKKVIVFLAIAIVLFKIETIIPVPTSGLIAIMAMGFIILEKYEILAHRLSLKFNKVWVIAEIILFVLVGAQLNLNSLLGVWSFGLLLICLGLVGRSLGILLSLRGQKLNCTENTFCVIAFTPKATIQAALGAIPLSLGIPHGDMILAISVLSIIVTAPLGALGIKWSSKRLLKA